MELSELLSRPRRRSLHRCRSLLPDLQSRAVRLPLPDHPVRTAHQRRHGKICGRKHRQAAVEKRYLRQNARVAILGFTFKEDCPDTRNTKVIDIVKELRDYGIEPILCDPEADAEEAKREYSVTFTDYKDLKALDLMVIAVAHQSFKDKTLKDFDKLYQNPEAKILMDLKGILDKQTCEKQNYTYWRL